MQKLRFFGFLATTMIGILCAALVLVWFTVNPNDYKGRIAALVRQSTGRELNLSGDIKLSVVPRIALELGPATLGNPPGFSDEPFLSITHASIRVRLLPLLRKRLAIARVQLDGLDLRLQKNAQGHGNWQSPASAASLKDPASGDATSWEGLPDVLVHKGRVSYEGMTLSNIELESGSVGADRQIPVRLSFDDTQLQGNLKLPSAKERPIEFDLAADRIDLDLYRAPEGQPESSPGPAVSSNETSVSPPLNANGTFRLKAARVAHVDVTDLSITIAARDHVLHLFPIEAQAEGGRYAGNITLDSRGVVPLISLDEHLNGVELTRLLASTAQKGRLSGRANVILKATARGATADALLKTLTGHFEASVAEGALEGIDLSYEMSVAQALIDRSSAPPKASTGRTKFDALKVSAQISNGVADTQDLTIASQVLKVTGQGSANLASKAIDFKLLAEIVAAPARVTEIPLKITGTFVAPTVRPDIESVAKDQLKNKLQDVLKKNGLEGLFKR